MTGNNHGFSGLRDEEIDGSRRKYGANVQDDEKNGGFFVALANVVKEPMFILLVVASTVYFITGNMVDGIIMVSAIALVSAISVYQDYRSSNAVAALRSLTQPKSKVIRNGRHVELNSEEIVVGDYVIVEEGALVPADGIVVKSNDFSVNESILTGESLSVIKSVDDQKNKVYQGSSVAGGLAIIRITGVGKNTRLGNIGKSIFSIKAVKTQLQVQIGNFVKKMAIAGVAVFLLVWAINYFQSKDIFDSLLQALTLAMSILPEEIPVAFTTFMALGSWRLMKMGIIVKQTSTVESLGSATVICVDKTGTITENRMTLVKLVVAGSAILQDPDEVPGEPAKELVRMAMWASEPIPFDPMEIALHKKYREWFTVDERPGYKMIHEYPLGGQPPMMTHIFENRTGVRIIAAKGAPEAIIRLARLSGDQLLNTQLALQQLTAAGYRVLAVATGSHTRNDFPEDQQDFQFKFNGLVAFYDPPKPNIRSVFKAFEEAGIRVKIITGDNELTTRTIAGQVQFIGAGKSLGGDQVDAMAVSDLRRAVNEVHIFTRMFPEAKLKVIDALKQNGEVVAMTGDGVNDGPALKAAHIGVAMGKKGTEIARQASSIILTDDDLAGMVDAVAMGRKIYSNLKKAVRYIISIHIPIIMVVFIPLALGWVYPNIFTPVHVIFLELIMGPTCSIIYENEPIEKNIMQQKPRLFSTSFFNWRELATSILQGLVISLGTLFIYQYAVYQGANEHITRTMVFLTLVAANIFLTLVNRSFLYSIIATGGYKNNLLPFIILLTVVMTGLLLFIDSLRNLFNFEKLETGQLLISTVVGFVSVIWFEGVKYIKRKRLRPGEL